MEEQRIIEDEQCYSLLIWLQSDFGAILTRRTDDGYSYKRTAELYREYKEKCTRDNYLFIRLLQFLLAYFIALKVGQTKGVKGSDRRKQRRSARLCWSSL